MLRALVVAGLMVLGANAAVAEPSVALSSSGACPTRDAVIAALVTALPDATVVAADAGVRQVVVRDDGASYRVELDGLTRTFVDADARCAERARKVAVVVALALAPPVVDPAIGRSPPAAPSAVLVPRVPAGLAVQLEAGGVVDHAVRAGDDLTAAGVDARLAIVRGDLGLVIGGVVTTSTSTAVTGGGARILRVPIDLAIRAQRRSGVVVGAIELGPRFAIQRSEGVDVMASSGEVRLEVGIRAAARVELWLWPACGLFAAVQGEYVPRPSRFTLPALGEVGQMPAMWFGASVGFAIRAR